MSSSDEDDASDTNVCDNSHHLRRKASHVHAYPRAYPASLCENYCPPRPTVPEEEALSKLKSVWLQSSEAEEADREELSNGHGKQVLVFDLEDFSIYEKRGHDWDKRERDLSPLHRLNAHHLDQRSVCGTMQVDGTLSVGTTSFVIQNITFDAFSVEGYDDATNPTVTTFIQTPVARVDPAYDIWYRLTVPSEEYRVHFTTFLWIAQFGKHFIDYLGASPVGTVELSSFESYFFRWLQCRFKDNAALDLWISQFHGTDFRQVVNANLGFLYNQAGTLDNSEDLLSHPVWADCGSSHHRLILPNESTTITPFVHHFFKDLYFSQYLEELPPEASVAETMRLQQEAMGFLQIDPTTRLNLKSSSSASTSPSHLQLTDIEPGDVVGVRPDPNTSWKNTNAEWIAYVQAIEDKEDDTELALIYLYRPTDTTISDVWFHNNKELFFSDNCNCGEPAYMEAVTRKYDVAWNPTSMADVTGKDFFVRQKYVTNEHEFVTLRDSDFMCQCRSSVCHAQQTKYQRGDTVYYKTVRERKTILEPAIIESFDRSENRFELRKLLRLARDCPNLQHQPRRTAAPPNELVWTDDLIIVSAKMVHRKCQIRFYSMEQKTSRSIPRPYDQDGTGDYWYITSRSIGGDDMKLQPLTAPFPGPMNQGFDPKLQPSWKPLQGLSLFSGGGGLDRGLEEGGAVEFVAAVDILKEAILTQKANALHPKKLHAFHASVNTILKAVMTGRTMSGIPRVGEIEVIAAGSPCPGFSMLQKNHFSEQSLKNASLITTFLSFVDVYRPQYALLENVTNIAKIGKGQQGTKVLSSLISCLVSMGYQVKQFVLDAWNHNSVQKRSRIFLCATAPGLTPMVRPYNSHSHYNGVGAHSLGVLPNKEKFAQREDYPTPFQHRKVAEAFDDLPNIGPGSLQACIPFPDHRVSLRLNAAERATMERVPNATALTVQDAKKGFHISHGPDLYTALELGLVPDGLCKYSSAKETHCPSSRRFRRINPDGLSPTILTRVNPRDSRTGDVVHYLQPRPMTIQEARRVQGVPDNEIIIGSTEKQWHIIGNGVDRNKSSVLGLSLRDAVEWNHSIRDLLNLPSALENVALEREDDIVDYKTYEDGQVLPLSIQFFKDGTWTGVPPEDEIQASLRESTGVSIHVQNDPAGTLPSPPDSTIFQQPPCNKHKRDIDTQSEGSSGTARKRTRLSGLAPGPMPTIWHMPVEHVIAKSRGDYDEMEE